MATQGIVSIVNGEKVVFKCVAGCNGMTATETANKLKALTNPTLDEVYDVCLENDFGCDDCLVVQSETEHKDRDGEGLSQLYTDKFNDAEFNPRWESGIASHVEVIEHTQNTV